MKEEGWVPNECTYNAKVKVHSSVGDFDAALDTVQQMQAQGFPPGKAAWAVIMPMAQAMGRHDIVQQVALSSLYSVAISSCSWHFLQAYGDHSEFCLALFMEASPVCRLLCLQYTLS